MATLKGDVIKYSQAGVIAINTVLGGVIDMLNWPTGVSIQVASMGTTGIITPEVSNDDSAAGVWVGISAINAASPAVPQGTLTTAGIYLIPQNARFLRLRLSTATTAGTMTIAVTNAGENPTFAAVQGSVANGATASGNPVRVAGTAQTALPATGANNSVKEMVLDNQGKQVVKMHAVPEVSFAMAGPIAGLTTAADTAINAAGAAGVRNYLTAIQVGNNSATAGELQIKDGAGTVLWRMWLPANMLPQQFQFDVPLKGTAATALNAQAVTVGMVAVFNAQGYQAA